MPTDLDERYSHSSGFAVDVLHAYLALILVTLTVFALLTICLVFLIARLTRVVRSVALLLSVLLLRSLPMVRLRLLTIRHFIALLISRGICVWVVLGKACRLDWRLAVRRIECRWLLMLLSWRRRMVGSVW